MSGTQDQLKALLAGQNVFGGWGGMDEQGQESQEARHEAALQRYLDAKEIAEPFMSGPGRLALEALEHKTIRGPSWPVDEMGLINAVGYGIYREGQNSLIRYIHECIRIAEEGPPGQEVDDGRGKEGRSKGRRRKAPGTDGR